MDITMTKTHAQTEKQLSGLAKLVIGSLVGIALLYVYVQAVLIKKIEMPLPIFQIISLVLAALIAGRPFGGWRWTPLLGAVLSLVLVLGSFQRLVYHLAHPEDLNTFAAQLLMIALLAVGIVAGVAATVQNCRKPAAERHMPRWVGWGVIMMAGLFVGAVLVAAIPQTGSAVQVSPAELAKLPVISLDVFNGGEIRVKAGTLTALRLENPDAQGHSFDVDTLDLHAAMPSERESLALFTADTPGTYTFYCAPHYDKASGRGMHGTLIVEP